ncbi:MAG: D-alanyl-D-alanine carboxypeptidase/D-alanyl-D-alanine-endopeptidase [Gammaproteobacteria bacterium]|nr:D-alanyl-D-alanine carboxypeptidase/D-alanyl-D-alanine-endopeptidase [Gammaproteobacteria bacterium]
MPRRILQSILLGFIFFAMAITAQASPYPRCGSIPNGLDSLLSRVNNSSVHIGIVVQSLQTGHVYYSKNADRFFAPASIQKIFTVSSALVNLKPDYRFPTRLMMTGNINQGVLHGDLIFQFNGDPTLTQSNLIQLVDRLRADGIQRVQGNIIIDDTAFNHIPYPAGWVWDDLSFDFAAPLNTVIINRNRFGVSFIPAKRIGEKATIVPHLPPHTATFINELVTTNHVCPLTILSNANNQYLVRGCLPRAYGTEGRALAIRNMQLYTKNLIHELLGKYHIQFNSGVYYAKTPVGAQLISDHLSEPLSHLIIHLLKHSDNLYADALFKKMGEEYTHTQGSWQNALDAEKPILTNKVGIDPNKIHLIDGAGLSRYNLITPESVSRMLSYIYRNPMLHDVLIPALPIAGVDGTLAGRMPMLARGEKLHAKTGSMTGVSSLAGFIKTRHHGVLSFVIMINNIPKNRAPYIVLENHIGEFLATTGDCNY